MKKVAEFEKVSFDQFKNDWIDTFGQMYDERILKIYNNIKLPKRSTVGSAGHDISIPFDINVAPSDILKIPTGIRCRMNKDYVMLVFPRSSLGIKKGIVLLNTTAVIDSDYFFANNEGHIFICIKNTSNDVVHFKEGNNIVQAVFLPFGVADTEEITNERIGGIGSTTKNNECNKKKSESYPVPTRCTHCEKLILTKDKFCRYCGAKNDIYLPE